MSIFALLRTIVGFIVAPIFPVLLLLILATLSRISVTGFGPREFSEALGPRELSEAKWLIGLSAVLAYPIAIAFGVPLHIIFSSRGWSRCVVYVGAGAFQGLLVYLLYVLLPEYFANGWGGLTERFFHTALVQIPTVMICGATAAVVFWLIARPDRSS